MKKIFSLYVFVVLIMFSSLTAIAQQKKIEISTLSKQEILALTNDELLTLSIEDLDKLAGIVGVSVEELLDLSIKSGGKGGFGSQLEDLNVKTYLHGYTDVFYRNIDLNRGRINETFSAHYFNPIIGVNVKDKIIAEAMLEYEHAGAEIALRYAFLDYAFSKYATLRVGKFLMPIGRYNEYFYPEHINLFVDRPFSHFKVLPSVWSEVGAQLRGNIQIKNEFSVIYNFFVVNGLQQTGGIGGDIRNMRDNFRDYKNDDKAYGGRIGIKPIKEIEVGYSYYTGAYSEDGKMNMAMGCFDAEFATAKFTLRGEYVYAIQDTLNGTIDKSGGFVETAYRINKYFQPAIRMETSKLPNVAGLEDINGDKKKDFNTEDIQKLSFGINFFPEPELLSRFTFKLNYNVILNDGQGKQRNEYILQAALGF